ncbi:DUF2964 family protein [Burkholderia glumae]|uniref:DUF2964 family protein n=1 Tax=Burkholderia glumae TaxID=337 RepID=A0AAQ0BPK2_BURGL|nr:DUF2964 family protein [Burkholderia glumae]AJY63001.1 hypothetical protein KS03_3896 [Burkholderia glumae LMG 2196 = ATCC 33617]KHJ63201.1 hypothetical protein NCPPB3923_09390 [Burkholderia glumae]MCM2484456.1 DUF2964 family protein [Burkholderia glumae]MCM2494825.1 DUF2964 family protein [Burkholderia glumae]MCM2510148.1 DUF2964 family protein [Burkholderia glumae]
MTTRPSGPDTRDRKAGRTPVVCATFAVFGALAGLGMLLDGLLYGRADEWQAGAALLVAGIAAAVVALNWRPPRR